jgi:F-type H+-transporting ATPase subunit c
MGLYYLGLALGIGLGLPIAVIGAGMGQGRVGGSAMEAMARQPEMAGRIQTGMLIAMAFIESLVIYALVMFFMLNGKAPSIDQAKELAPLVSGTSTSAPR